MKLPKGIRNHNKAAAIESWLRLGQETLWSGGDLQVPVVDFGTPLKHGLHLAKAKGRLVVGMDKIKYIYRNETEVASSWQSLLVLTDGGSERLYRGAEGLVKRHPEIFVLRVAVAPEELGAAMFKKDKAIKAILVKDSAALGQILLDLAEYYLP